MGEGCHITTRRLEDAVKGPRGGRRRWGTERSVRRPAPRAQRNARRGRPPPPRFESRLRHRLAEDPQASDFTFREGGAGCAALAYRGARRTIIGGSRTDWRRQCGAARPEPTSGRPDWPGLCPTGAREGRAPHRACAAPRAPGEEARPRPRVERALPPQPPHPAPAPLNRLPISPTPRRTATASRHSPLPARRAPGRFFALGPPLPPPPQPTCPP